MSPVRRLLALLDREPEQYVSEAKLRHSQLQRALADLEPPETQPWLEPVWWLCLTELEEEAGWKVGCRQNF